MVQIFHRLGGRKVKKLENSITLAVVSAEGLVNL